MVIGTLSGAQIVTEAPPVWGWSQELARVDPAGSIGDTCAYSFAAKGPSGTVSTPGGASGVWSQADALGAGGPVVSQGSSRSAGWVPSPSPNRGLVGAVAEAACCAPAEEAGTGCGGVVAACERE